MNFVQGVTKFFKRFFAGSKQQCCASMEVGDSIFYCVLGKGHASPHKTYLGRWFWICKK